MSLLVEFDEEVLENVFAQYLRDSINRIHGYPDDAFDGPNEKRELLEAISLVHNWIAMPSEWI